MPLRLAWSQEWHLKDAPQVFSAIWAVSSIAMVLVAFLSFKKVVTTVLRAYRKRARRDHIFLPRLQEAEISLTLMPLFFAWIGWGSVFNLQVAAVLRFLLNIVTAVMLTTTRDLLLAALGEEPGLKDLLKTAVPQAWWRTPPCCCAAGVCVTGEPEKLRPRHLRFGKYMVDFFVMVNLVDAVNQIIENSAIQRVEKVDGWCTTAEPTRDVVQKFFAVVQGVSSPFAMYAVSVLAKGVTACLGEEDHLQMMQKGNMAGTISLFTGLGPLLAGTVASGYEDPKLGPDSTLITGAEGCPVYDKEVMAQVWFAASLPVLMVPFAMQLGTLVQAEDAKMAQELRAERLKELLVARAGGQDAA